MKTPNRVSPAMRFPAPLRPRDLIAITAPSSGVETSFWPRLQFCVQFLRDKGFEVRLGECLDGTVVRSAPAAERAAELTNMLTDPDVRAIVPPWGGELAIDLLELLDFDAIGAADPTWLIGYSDITTLMLPLTLRTGVATMHAPNLMDTPYRVPDGLLHWLDAVTAPAGSALEQRASGRRLSENPKSIRENPEILDWEVDGVSHWFMLDHESSAAASGRLMGGCLETLAMLPGTPFGDVAGFGRAHADEGLIVYLEVAESVAPAAARMLHHLKLAGWFKHANAVLVGRGWRRGWTRLHPARGAWRHCWRTGHPGLLRPRLRPRPTAGRPGQRRPRPCYFGRFTGPAAAAVGLRPRGSAAGQRSGGFARGLASHRCIKRRTICASSGRRTPGCVRG